MSSPPLASPDPVVENLQVAQQSQSRSVVRDPLEYEIAQFEFQQRRAKLFSASRLVPDVFQGTNGIPNILIGMEIASRLKMPLLAVLQSLVVIHGRPSWVGSFVVALINKSERFDVLTYKYTSLGRKKFKGVEFDDIGCQIATKTKSGIGVLGPMVTMEMAHRDGWVKNDKYASMPETMLAWRAVAFFARFYCPEVTMGLPSADEMETTPREGHTTYSSGPDPRRPQINIEQAADDSPPVDTTLPPDINEPTPAVEPEPAPPEPEPPKPRRPRIPIDQLTAS